MGMLLRCESLAKSFGARALFAGLTFGLLEEERTGLIGPNGAGKSTLLKILAGLEHADTGEVSTRRQLRVGYVAQEDVFAEGMNVREVVEDAIAGEHLEEHERATQAAIMLGRVGFADFEQPASALSGGWKKRLSIARALVARPDLLMLDEPTNHLDLEGILWLEKLLRTTSMGVLMVSHDRYLLQNAANRIIELNRTFPGGYYSVNSAYADFLAKREEFLAGQQRTQSSLANRVRREIEWLNRGAKARTTKAKFRIEDAGRMKQDLEDLRTRNAQDASPTIDFAATGRKTQKLLAARDLAMSLGGRRLFADLSFVLSPGLRLGLVGPNGSGKTTLLRLLTGQLSPEQGEIVRAEGLRIVHFEQGRDQLDKSLSLRKALAPQGDTVFTPDGGAMHVSSWARKFLFQTDQLDMLVGEMSGGEQARILIARLMVQSADLLILDEPTNDLDLNTLEVLEESLTEFPGALILVTHDRYMIDTVCTDILGLDGTSGASVYSDYQQWERAFVAAKEAAAEKAQAPKPTTRPQPAGPKRLTYMEQRELEQMEAAITSAEENLATWQATMADGAVLADRARLHEACEKVHAAEELVRKLYARWDELEAKQRASGR